MQEASSLRTREFRGPLQHHTPCFPTMQRPMAHESGPGGTARLFCVDMVSVDVRRDPRVVDLTGSPLVDLSRGGHRLPYVRREQWFVILNTH
jgi:hypothetical protein